MDRGREAFTDFLVGGIGARERSDGRCKMQVKGGCKESRFKIQESRYKLKADAVDLRHEKINE